MFREKKQESTTIQHVDADGIQQQMKPSNPWASGLFYLTAFVVITLTLALAGRLVSPLFLPFMVFGALLPLIFIGALQLRNDERLCERSFLKLMVFAFRYLPWPGKTRHSSLPHRQNVDLPNGSSTDEGKNQKEP